MTELIEEASKWALGALATVVSFLGIDVYRRVNALQKEKADRSEVSALVERLDRGHEQLLARIDKANDDHSKRRDRLHEKIDGLAEAVNRLAGQREGK